MMLQALNLAVALEDSTTGADVSMYLSVLYGEKGIKEKVLSYVKRSLSLRGKKSSEAVFEGVENIKIKDGRRLPKIF